MRIISAATGAAYAFDLVDRPGETRIVVWDETGDGLFATLLEIDDGVVQTLDCTGEINWPKDRGTFSGTEAIQGGVLGGDIARIACYALEQMLRDAAITKETLDYVRASLEFKELL